MAIVKIFNDDQRVAITSRAFNCKVVHELMRCYTLDFDIVNTDAARKYILPNPVQTTFICDGQAYDLSGYQKQSGASGNTMSVSANHVGLRLDNYTLAAGYAFVGTVQQIANDILQQATDESGKMASTEFEVGTVPNLGTISFSLNNTEAVTARYAIMALKNVGAEMDWDNFTINFAETITSGHSETFEFGVNMTNVEVTYDKSNGSTYEINIADLQEIPGHVGDIFDIGDTVTVKDFTTGESFSKRIITYTRYLDNPTKNSITLGVFVRNMETATAMMSIDVDKSVKTYGSYSNVSIDHMDGLKCVRSDGNVRVMQNATKGFVIQKNNSGTWTDILSISTDGVINITALDNPTLDNSVQQGQQYSNVSISAANGFVATSTDGKLQVKMNAADCFAVYANGTKAAWLDANGLSANKLTSSGTTVYGKIGEAQLDDGQVHHGIFIADSANSNNASVILMPLPSGGFTLALLSNSSAQDILVADVSTRLFRPLSNIGVRDVLYAGSDTTWLSWFNDNETDSLSLQLDETGVHFIKGTNTEYGYTGEIYIEGTVRHYQSGILLD